VLTRIVIHLSLAFSRESRRDNGAAVVINASHVFNVVSQFTTELMPTPLLWSPITSSHLVRNT
jgi:hypothetical protein